MRVIKVDDDEKMRDKESLTIDRRLFYLDLWEVW